MQNHQGVRRFFYGVSIMAMILLPQLTALAQLPTPVGPPLAQPDHPTLPQIPPCGPLFTNNSANSDAVCGHSRVD